MEWPAGKLKKRYGGSHLQLISPFVGPKIGGWPSKNRGKRRFFPGFEKWVVNREPFCFQRRFSDRNHPIGQSADPGDGWLKSLGFSWHNMGDAQIYEAHEVLIWLAASVAFSIFHCIPYGWL